MRRHRLLPPLPLLPLLLLAAACGGASTAASEPDVAPTSAVADADAFPVTIEHRHGATTLEQRPERIVTVGLTDHDALLALGITPVGVTDWYGDHPHATWPWAQDELGDAEPEVVGNAQELDLERIAALEPDLVLGLYSALTAEQYETLSQIAPVVAQPDDHVDYGVPWQQLTRTAGEAVGEAELADRLVTEVEGRIAAVRDEHPEFVGASAAIATPYEGVYVYSPEVGNVRLLRDLGFEVPAEIAELVGDADGAELSLERVDLLDTDVLVWLDATPGEGPLAEELYTNLDVHTEGREVHVSSVDAISGASFISVLSLPEILDQVVPMLAAAVDGDPATAVPTVP